mgnify:CR=1 FL=1
MSIRIAKNLQDIAPAEMSTSKHNEKLCRSSSQIAISMSAEELSPAEERRLNRELVDRDAKDRVYQAEMVQTNGDRFHA